MHWCTKIFIPNSRVMELKEREYQDNEAQYSAYITEQVN